MSAPSKLVLATRKRGLTVRPLDGEVLIYDPETTRASCLNEFASEVLSRCDGGRTLGQIARDLPFDDVDERIVAMAIADLRKAELLEPGSAGDITALTGPSRRDLIRRLGAGAAVAVPVVTAILLPSPAQALSAGDTCYIQGGSDPCASVGLQCRPRQGGGNCFFPGADCLCQQPKPMP
jgi:hypothetical protein